MFKRIALFLATNLAVLALLSIVMAVLQNVFGITLGNNGQLLVFATVFGFGGSFISLLISKWMAKRTTGAHVIEQPRNESEQWLVNTVRLLRARLAVETDAWWEARLDTLHDLLPHARKTITGIAAAPLTGTAALRVIHGNTVDNQQGPAIAIHTWISSKQQLN